MIYFDNAATTGHKPSQVIRAVNNALEFLSANPGRSGHNASQKTAIAVYRTRKEIADYFNSEGAENVIFTTNCTHSINFVLKGVLRSGDHIIVSDMEHNAVMRPLVAMKANYSIAQVSLSDDEETLNNFKKKIKPNTKMILCTAASNVIGKQLPLKLIGKLCKEKNILFAVDAAQGGGVIPINMKEMNIDYLCIAPHKGFYSPMGLGVLIARKQIEHTVIEGGTGTDSLNFNQPMIMPEMLESGTINVPAIIGMYHGLQFVKQRGNGIFKNEMQLIYKLFDEFADSPNIIFYTNPHISTYVPVLSFNIKGVSSDETAAFLSDNNFALRAGLHCAPTAHKKIGTLEIGTVRFSPSVFNNEYEVKSLINAIKKFKKPQKFY